MSRGGLDTFDLNEAFGTDGLVAASSMHERRRIIPAIASASANHPREGMQSESSERGNTENHLSEGIERTTHKKQIGHSTALPT